MTTFNPDRIFYVVFCDHGARIGIGETVVSDRRELIDNIVRRELGYEKIIEIHAYNPVEMWSHIVTEDVMDEVAAEIQCRQDAEDFPLSRFTQQAAE